MTTWKTGTDLGKTPLLELISDYWQNKIEELIQNHKIWKVDEEVHNRYNYTAIEQGSEQIHYVPLRIWLR